jgi:drug/metabolite transporter (DMT)-like permease
VVQLQVVVAMVLAVLTMHEPFTVLQSFGAALMLAGSFATQKRSAAGTIDKARSPAFTPVSRLHQEDRDWQ